MEDLRSQNTQLGDLVSTLRSEAAYAKSTIESLETVQHDQLAEMDGLRKDVISAEAEVSQCGPEGRSTRHMPVLWPS